ncbi:hypothetical protein [Streptomyces sp. R44]|uniref:Uncharacterized protein n=1 Tax=Streptomyces sp. R44 TaxID=3238633 RepID=A0AB39T9U4_9ACTN
MVAEESTAPAAVGGTAVVRAAGTSAWPGLRQAVVGWFGREDFGREDFGREDFGREDEESVGTELDRSAHALTSADDAVAEAVRRAVRDAWQARFETALAGLADHERGPAAEALRALLDAHAPSPAAAVSATGDGLAVGGDVAIRADHGSVAALRMGDVTLANPPLPGPPQY